MADALVSPAVAGVASVASLALIAVAVRRVRASRDEQLVPLMGVMGAFVFAAQMINFTIPGTGSSGHLVGGILLAALLGPWAGFITLTSVIIIQCLVFADGGLMALGCNILNMAACSTLVAYPLLFRPLARLGGSWRRTMWVSIVACVVSLELGAVAVTLETVLSGITVLPFGRFLLFMLPIHLLIGIGEGLATAAVVGTVERRRPDLLAALRHSAPSQRKHLGRPLLVITSVALLLAGSAVWIASSHPDGLEWSIAKTTGDRELVADTSHLSVRLASDLQQRTAVLPDYNTTTAGLVGSGAFVLTALAAGWLIRLRRRRP